MRIILLVMGFLILLPQGARATFSIVACDADKSCGAAAATNNLEIEERRVGKECQ